MFRRTFLKVLAVLGWTTTVGRLASAAVPKRLDIFYIPSPKWQTKFKHIFATARIRASHNSLLVDLWKEYQCVARDSLRIAYSIPPDMSDLVNSTWTLDDIMEMALLRMAENGVVVVRGEIDKPKPVRIVYKGHGVRIWYGGLLLGGKSTAYFYGDPIVLSEIWHEKFTDLPPMVDYVRGTYEMSMPISHEMASPLNTENFISKLKCDSRYVITEECE